jgi:hypothetical protein
MSRADKGESSGARPSQGSDRSDGRPPDILIGNLYRASCMPVLSLIPILHAQSQSHLKALSAGPATPAGQRFFCAGPYTIRECKTEVATLQAVLQRYDGEKLGK